jgi:TrmH family RNA methyltransferase
VAEGLRMCSEIPKERIRALYVSESFRKQPEYSRLTAGVRQVEVVTDEVFKALSDTQTPQGILALVKQYHYTLDEVVRTGRESQRPALLMVLERLQDPGNLGTILRAGEGAGITGLVMNRDTAERAPG